MGPDSNKTGLPRLLITSIVALALAGCWTQSKKEHGKVAGSAGGDTNMSYIWRGFPQPVDSPRDAEILVEKMVPKSVRPLQTFKFRITIRNNAKYAIDDVTVTEKRPAGFRYVKAVPAPTSRETALVWNLGRLGPREKREIVVTGKPANSTVGIIRYSGETSLKFRVATDSDFASTVHVIQPNLQFLASAPKAALIGTRIPMKLNFKNVGEASVVNAKLVYTLPKGLLTYEGKSRIEKAIGTLAPNATRNFAIDLKGVAVTKDHPYNLVMRAVADEGVSAEAKVSLTITKPVLTLKGRIPRTRFVGNAGAYVMTVTNTGTAPADNLVVKLSLPSGVALKSADEGGRAVGGKVVWKLPSLKPGASKKVVAKVIFKEITMAHAEVEAVAKAANRVTTAMNTDVKGIAGLLTTVVDEDPVPVGDTTTYTIIADNTGSLDATDIVIKCTLPKELKFVSCSGATKGKAADGTVVFESLPALSPHEKAKWFVVAKAITPGDIRFKTTVRSAQLDRDIDIFESTHLYK